MKHTLGHILQILLFPLIWCRQVILDAPIVDCGDELIGFGTFRKCR